MSRFCPDGGHILTAGEDEKATIWNIHTKEKIRYKYITNVYKCVSVCIAIYVVYVVYVL